MSLSEIDPLAYEFIKILIEANNDIIETKKLIIALYPEKKEEIELVCKEFLEITTVNKERSLINQTLSHDYPVKDISLNVTQECNLRCIYCYGKDGSYGNPKKMTYDVAEKQYYFLSIIYNPEMLLILIFLEENHS